MKINQQELEKLSIADMLFLASTMAAKEEQGEKLNEGELQMISHLHQECQLRTKLLFKEDVFDFKKYLIEVGYEFENGEKVWYFRKFVANEPINVICCYFDNSCKVYHFGKLLFNHIQPNTRQKAEWLLKILDLQ